MPRVPIGDGYDCPYTTKPTARTGPVALVYRPPLPMDEITHIDALRKDAVGGRGKVLFDFLVKHLVRWDLADDKGEPVPITAEVLATYRDLSFLYQIENEILRSQPEVAAEVPKS